MRRAYLCESQARTLARLAVHCTHHNREIENLRAMLLYQLRRGKAAERKLTVRPGNKFTKLGQALPRPRGIPA
jgi:hypothetical protein